MNSALITAFQACVMLILLFFGYFLYKKDFLDENSSKRLSNITISIISPIVIFNAYQTDFNPELLKGLLTALALAFASQALSVLAARLIVRKTHKDFEVERFAIGYSNCAFMGIPLAEATYGSEGVFYLTAYITAFNVFMWTHGVVMMSGKKMSGKGLVKIVLSPAMLSIILGLVCFFTGFRVPEIIQQPLNYLGALNTPLAMVVSGATIAMAGIKSCFTKKRVYFLQAFRLLLLPAVIATGYAVARHFGANATAVGSILVAAAAPTASAAIMFSHKFAKNAEYASNHFAVSTILSMATMPLILAFYELVCGWIS